MKDITDLFKETKSKLVQNIISEGGVILAEKFENFREKLEEPGLGDRIAKVMEEKTGIKGFIATSELPGYGISAEERKAIEEALGLKEEDVGILVADKRDRAEAGLKTFGEEVR
ncbi:MAG: hypothetical protein PVF58_01795 [Candidatus Methanofastidiosia archaeon]|jgi:Glu-tRNA(Gln) amidotransferase subunit E-like FAD-binding protein